MLNGTWPELTVLKLYFIMYATIYDPGENRCAHCCIHYSSSHAKFGAWQVDEFLLEAGKLNIPVFDITHVYSVIGLSVDNVIERGGIRIQ